MQMELFYSTLNASIATPMATNPMATNPIHRVIPYTVVAPLYLQEDDRTLAINDTNSDAFTMPQSITETIVIDDSGIATATANANATANATANAAANPASTEVAVKHKYTKKTVDPARDAHENFHIESPPPPPPVVIKKHYRNVLVFDTETTGFLPKITPENINSPEMPRIIQLSYILFDTRNYRIKKMGNYYIKLDEGIQIPPFITEITGITQHTCDTRGHDITEALIDFYNTAIQADCIIAHNIAFDIRMIEFEIERNYAKLEHRVPQIISLFNPIFLRVKNIDTFCTMKSSVNVCNIIKLDKNNRPYKKYPKLCELYLHLFQSVPNHLHNAVMDVIVCLRCFIKFYMEKDIHDVKFNRIISMAMQLV
jgi:DNA polymerase III epsilon subunit-like protein